MPIKNSELSGCSERVWIRTGNVSPKFSINMRHSVKVLSCLIVDSDFWLLHRLELHRVLVSRWSLNYHRRNKWLSMLVD